MGGVDVWWIDSWSGGGGAIIGNHQGGTNHYQGAPTKPPGAHWVGGVHLTIPGVLLNVQMPRS